MAKHLQEILRFIPLCICVCRGHTDLKLHHETACFFDSIMMKIPWYENSTIKQFFCLFFGFFNYKSHQHSSLWATQNTNADSNEFPSDHNFKLQIQMSSSWVGCLCIIWRELLFLGTDSLFSFWGQTQLSDMLVLVLDGETPTLQSVCKHVINYTINILGWQILIRRRNCTGKSALKRYDTVPVSSFYFKFIHSENSLKPWSEPAFPYFVVRRITSCTTAVIRVYLKLILQLVSCFRLKLCILLCNSVLFLFFLLNTLQFVSGPFFLSTCILIRNETW